MSTELGEYHSTLLYRNAASMAATPDALENLHFLLLSVSSSANTVADRMAWAETELINAKDKNIGSKHFINIIQFLCTNSKHEYQILFRPLYCSIADIRLR